MRRDALAIGRQIDTDVTPCHAEGRRHLSASIEPAQGPLLFSACNRRRANA
jgi:hypothetical protein